MGHTSLDRADACGSASPRHSMRCTLLAAEPLLEVDFSFFANCSSGLGGNDPSRWARCEMGRGEVFFCSEFIEILNREVSKIFAGKIQWKGVRLNWS